MATIAELEKEAQELAKMSREAQARVEAAKDADAEARRVPLQKIVERAHECFCRWNHTDGCGWHYEKSWRDGTHLSWLRKYDVLVNGDAYNRPVITLEQLEATISAIEELKPKIGLGLNLFRDHKLNP